MTAGETPEAPLRVLHILHSISPLCGGPSHGIWFTLQASTLRGIESHIATTDDDGRGAHSAVPIDRFVDLRGHRVRHFRRETRFYAASLPMLRWLWTHVRDYDVVHVHALFSFAPVVAAYCARLRRVPYIISPHGVLGTWGLRHRRPLLKQASVRWVEGPAIRSAASVQLTSRRELRDFAELGIKVRTEVIPYAMPLDALEDAGAWRPEAGLLALVRNPTVLFLSRIHPIKALDVLLRAFVGVIRQHPTAMLVIAGDGNAQLVAELKQLAAALGIGRHLRWLGFVAGPLKRWLLDNTDVFVQPSWSENFGIAVAEAMAAGRPVVVTTGVGLADVVETTGSGLVCECDQFGLQTAIDSLLGDATARARMGAAGRRAVAQELSVAKYAESLERMYRQAAGRPAPPSATGQIP
jgi:glycosyltransferase involved in cell wall biosynthesis